MIKFLWDNWIDEAVLTVSSEDAEFPVENIQHRWHTRHWRSDGIPTGGVTIDIDLLEEKDVEELVIKYHNFRIGIADVHIQASDDNWVGTDINVHLTVTEETIVYSWTTPQSYRWWRITIDDFGNPDGYVRIGRPYLGPKFEPYWNYRKWKPTPRDPSDKSYSTGGQCDSSEETHFKEFEITFDATHEDDEDDWNEIFDKVGTSIPYFICKDPDDAVATTYYVQNLEDWEFDPIVKKFYGFIILVETMR